jgi:hypothetical protein
MFLYSVLEWLCACADEYFCLKVELFSAQTDSTDRSRAEKLWLVCGVMDDREREKHRGQKLYATIHSEKMTNLTIVFSTNVNFQQLYVFAMNNKAPPPSTNPSKKCRALFPRLEGRLAGEHTVYVETKHHVF